MRENPRALSEIKWLDTYNYITISICIFFTFLFIILDSFIIIQDFEDAKTLQRSLEKVARLRKIVMATNQTTISIIGSYPHPDPIVHNTMRATFLLLGNGLNETKVTNEQSGIFIYAFV